MICQHRSEYGREEEVRAVIIEGVAEILQQSQQGDAGFLVPATVSLNKYVYPQRLVLKHRAGGIRLGEEYG